MKLLNFYYIIKIKRNDLKCLIGKNFSPEEEKELIQQSLIDAGIKILDETEEPNLNPIMIVLSNGDEIPLEDFELFNSQYLI